MREGAIRPLAGILLLICAMFAATPSLASKVGLVIGNSAYENTGALPNPKNDARLFADFLRSVGFRVTEVSDATRGQMSEALTRFSNALQPDDTAVFYYAGHGLQMDGENYLVGIEAALRSQFDVPAETVSLSSIIQTLEARAHISILFIDACRDNPLADQLAKVTTTRSISHGLAPVQSQGDGTMIAFAALAGQVAYDGGTSNSPFTTALVAHLGEPGIEIGTAFKRVIRDVRQATGDKQVPQIVSSLSSEIYLGGETVPASNAPELPVQAADFPPVVATPAPAPADTSRNTSDVDVAELDYSVAQSIGTPRAWMLFLKKHPQGDLALAAMTALDSSAGSSPEGIEDGLGLSKSIRTRIQLELKSLGYDIGRPDGVFGRASRAAIADYQRGIGVEPTGFVNTAVLAGLNITYFTNGLGTLSAPLARTYDVAVLKTLESDHDLLNGLNCLAGREVTYGFYASDIYVAVLAEGGIDPAAARAEARKCGGELATITSAPQNDFIADLVGHDVRFFDFADGARGPLIGLHQLVGAASSSGGWFWYSGQSASFRAWARGEPNNWQRNREGFAVITAPGAHAPPAGALLTLDGVKWGDVEPGLQTGYIMEIQ